MRRVVAVACAAVSAVALAAALFSTPARAQKGKSPHKRLTLACEVCHSAESFKDIHFDHSTTGYALEGHHAVASCLACHNVEDFSKVDGACASCHSDVHRGRLGTTCEHCHAAGGWKVFDAEEIHADSNFPVMGRHLMVDCEGCHPGMPETDFRSTPTECVACHRADYEGVENPNHVQSGFSTDCRTCHQLMAWTPAVMSDHDVIFPIFSGSHRNQWSDCSECHTSPDNYRVFDCLTCHQHEQLATDSHHAGMPDYSYTSEACLSCHPTGAAAQFLVHDAQYFPIYSGTHVGQWTDCAACHTTGTVAFSCIDCHTHDQAAVDPTHNGMPGYSYTSDACYFCHPTGEKGNFVGHDALYFPIFSGTHSGRWTDCTACHTTGTAAFSCIDCHDHEQLVTDSHHVGMDGYAYASDACYSCHPTGVAGQFLVHDAQYFPIYSGTHVGQWTDCASCHTAGTAAFSCIDCHTHDPTTVAPTHNGMPGYSYTSDACYFCHPTGERGNFVDHDALYFPIFSGTHSGRWTDCAACHTTGTAAFSCIDCHDHEQVVTDSHHVGMDGYAYASDACYSCHPTGVAGQFLVHDAQYFPIYSGTHVGQWTDCVSCHTAGTAAFSCIDCHTHDPTTVDPTHNGMPGYAYASQSCIGCHPTGEAGRFVDHDGLYFPIYSGTHSGRWTDCAACHTTGTAAFSCIDCHDHEQLVTDSHHVGMDGYAYTSDACYSCHPTGVAGQFLVHDAQYFPIYSGTHSGRWTDCASCHTTGTTAFSCIDCHTHDQAAVDPTHNGMTGYSYASQSCFGCHPTGEAGNFVDHDAQFFPIYSGRHAGTWNDCATCHVSPGDNNVFSCFGCHTHDQGVTDSHHTSVSGYSYDSNECLRCHPNGRAEG